MSQNLCRWDEDAFWRKLILPKRTGKHRGKGKAIAGSDHPISSRSSSGGDRMKGLIPNCGNLVSSSPTSALERCAHISLDHRTFLQWMCPLEFTQNESGSTSFGINGASAEQNGKDCRPSRRKTVRLIVRPRELLRQLLQSGEFGLTQPLQLLRSGELWAFEQFATHSCRADAS